MHTPFRSPRSFHEHVSGRRPATAASLAGPLALLVLAGASPGSAQAAGGKTLVLESHSLPRTERRARLTAAVVGVQGEQALSGRALAAALDRLYGPRPAGLGPEERARAAADLKQADEAAIVGEWQKAVDLLGPVRKRLAGAPLAISRSKPLFGSLQRARLLLAQCALRLGKAPLARAYMSELLRAEPEAAVTLAAHGPELVHLHFAVKKDLDARPGARLEVVTDPPGALVFLSGRYLGVSPLAVDRLYQGTYDLLVLKDNQVSRATRLELTADRKVRIDLRLHQALDAGAAHGHAGLTLPEGPGRDTQELRYAMEIATRLGAARVVLVGLRELEGREVLAGQSLAVGGESAPVKAYIIVDRHDPTAETLERFGRFLAGTGAPGPGVLVGDLRAARRRGPGRGAGHARDAGPRMGGSRALRAVGWTLVGLGLAGAAAGGALLGIDDRIESSPGTFYQTGTGGYAALGAGLGAAVVGGVLLLVDALRRPEPGQTGTGPAALPPDPVAALAPRVAPRFAPIGSRAAPRFGPLVPRIAPRLAPILAPQPGGAFVGLTGRF